MSEGEIPVLCCLSRCMYMDLACFYPLFSGLEEILRFHPELVNLPKDDGYTPLHIAAANNFADLICLIASHVSKLKIIF